MKESDLYYTPEKYIESAKLVFGGQIDLDPTSSPLANSFIGANRIYTFENSMLENSLKCDTLFFNPPYSNPLPFVKKLVHEYKCNNINTIIGVLNLDCSTRWFKELSTIVNSYCLLEDRIKFKKCNPEQTEIKETNSNNKCQFFFYAGKNVCQFNDEFSQYGIILNTDMD